MSSSGSVDLARDGIGSFGRTASPPDRISGARRRRRPAPDGGGADGTCRRSRHVGERNRGVVPMPAFARELARHRLSVGIIG